MLAGSSFCMNFIIRNRTVASFWVISEVAQGFQSKQDWEFGFFVGLQEQEEKLCEQIAPDYLQAVTVHCVDQIQNQV